MSGASKGRGVEAKIMSRQEQIEDKLNCCWILSNGPAESLAD